MTVELFHSPEHNALIYRGVNIGAVTRYIPAARAINGAFVGVPISLFNLQILRRLELPVIAPMAGYDWPHSPEIEKPLQHQINTANFLVLNPHCFNLSDMGTMKTLSALWAADWLMQQHPKGQFRAIIAAPLSTLVSVWASAIFKNFLSRRSFGILHGSAAKRLKTLAEPHDFYIINHDGIGVGGTTKGRRFIPDGFSNELLNRADIRLAIVDEADAYRDATSNRHKAASLILQGREYFWLQTGTPTPNGPVDAYGLARLAHRHFAESFTGYKNRVMIKVSPFKWVPRRGAMEDAHKLLTPSIRVDIRDVWDGPKQTFQEREIPLTKEQTKHLHDLKRHLQIIMASNVQITPANEAVARMKFIQICCGAVYDAEHRTHWIDAAPRLDAVTEIVEKAARKVLIFAPLTSIVHLLYEKLRRRVGACYINGSVPMRERGKIIESFAKDAGRKVAIVDPATVAHGINEFVAADTIIWYGPTDKTVLYLQGNKRVDRPGQKYPNTVIEFTSTKLEQEIFARLKSNRDMQGVLLSMVKGNWL